MVPSTSFCSKDFPYQRWHWPLTTGLRLCVRGQFSLSMLYTEGPSLWASFLEKSIHSWLLISHLVMSDSDPMGCSMPGFPVLHHLLEFAQTHVHWVSQWRHPTISSSVTPFSSCLQSFPASGSFHLTISKPGPAPELPRLTLLPAFLVVFSRRGVTTTYQCFLPAPGCSSSLYPFNVFSEGIWYLLSVPYVILY